MTRNRLLIPAALAVFWLALFLDRQIGMPIFTLLMVSAFWTFLTRRIWQSRPGNVNDLRYNLAMAILFLVLALFAVMTYVPIYEGFAARLGWPPLEIPLLAN